MNIAVQQDNGLPTEMLQQFAKERRYVRPRQSSSSRRTSKSSGRSGYLTINVPKELGGKGFTLAEVCREQRRLAYHAPATALGINMHLYWIGVATDLWRMGDKSLEWMLREAVAGEIFAAGHAERGNDLPLLLSTTKAEKVSVDSVSRATRCSEAWRRSGPATASTACGRMPRADRKSCMAFCRAMPRDIV